MIPLAVGCETTKKIEETPAFDVPEPPHLVTLEAETSLDCLDEDTVRILTVREQQLLSYIDELLGLLHDLKHGP